MLDSRDFLIAASYIVTALGLGGLMLASFLDYRELRRALSRFSEGRKP